MEVKGVRYFYRDEGRRRVTVAYLYEPETGNTSYGASVFRRDHQGETYVKREHRDTAEQRLDLCPVKIRLNVADVRSEGQDEEQRNVEDLIRQAMMTHGVRGERLASDDFYMPYPGEVAEENEPFDSSELDRLAKQLFDSLPPEFTKVFDHSRYGDRG